MPTPTDPLYAQQWHLDAIGDIEAIWGDYTGTGIHVGVYDSNIQIDHPDLAANHDGSRLVSYNGTTPTDGINPGSFADQDHGTAVAGLISAAANGVGGVGVAYGSTFTGIAIFDDTSPLYINGTSAQTVGFLAGLQSLNFDVQNHSWGAYNNFFNGIGSGAAVAPWEYVAVNGRGGLGTNVVKAAGNDASNANADETNRGRTIIVVAATTINGFAASYSNYGANLLVSAPGGDFDAGIVTTDRLGTRGYNTRSSPSGSEDYTDRFNGTSAAAPIVSGVITLMLDANEGLGWRDVQNILALSAHHSGAAIGTATPQGTWQINDASNWNGGGLHFSEAYGYGLVNVYNAVRLAEVWSLFGGAKTSANEIVSTNSGAPNLIIPDRDGGGTHPVSFSFTVSDDVQIENLQLSLTVRHPNYTDLNITLTAPDGNVYILDDTTGGSTSVADNGFTWIFGVNALRGQSSVGTWTVSYTDVTQNSGNAAGAGTVTGYSASFYGSAPSADDVYHFTDEFLTFAGLDATRTTISDTDGGTDWLNLAAVAGNQTIDLATAGAWSSVSGDQWFRIADGTLIENVITGDGGDTILGNALNNRFYGMRGNDSLFGYGGDDSLDGGVGNDLLDGGAGFDAATYALAAAGVTVNLAITLAQATVGAGADMLRNIEQVIGSAFADRLASNSVTTLALATGPTESHGSRATAQSLDAVFTPGVGTAAPHATVDVTLPTGSQAEYFSFSALAGMTVSFAVTNSNYDGILEVYSSNGAFLASSGFFADHNRLSFTPSTDGVYFVNFLGGAATAGQAYTLDVSVPGHLAYILSARLDGGLGNDVLLSGTGEDRLNGGAGVDAVSYANATSGVTVSLAIAGAQTTGGGGLDTLSSIEQLLGSAFDDRLTGNALNNLLTGGAGNDTLDGGLGSNVLDGDNGIDTVSYLAALGGVTASLGRIGNQNTAGAGVDRYVSIENLIGSNFSDNLGGGSSNDTIEGAAGDDVIRSSGGNDVLIGGIGNDTLFGGEGDDVILGGDGNDVLKGNIGNDLMIGGAGNDGYYVDSVLDSATELAGEGDDAVFASVSWTLGANFERLVIDGVVHGLVGTGNALDNRITGDHTDDTLYGLDGNDFLTGNAGRDLLLGGNGDDSLFGNANRDELTGGAGRDLFRFTALSDTGMTTGSADIIHDFSHAEGDRILLNLIDADANSVDTNEAFSWIANANFGHVAGELRYQVIQGNTYVSGDVDGDALADFFIRLDGNVSIGASDFTL